jgi:hypothetical protein
MGLASPVGVGSRGGSVFEQIRSAVGVLEAVARGLEPWRLDGHDAAGLVELAARGERICASIKALGARRVEETKVWREGGHRSALDRRDHG